MTIASPWAFPVALLCLCLLLRPAAADDPPRVLLDETFADGAAALERWEFTADGPAHLEMQPQADGDAPRQQVCIDFRERAAWRFMNRQAFALEGGAQFTASANLRCSLGYGDFRLVVETTGEQPTTLATAPIVKRANEPHAVTIVFRAPASGAEVRVGLVARGYSEIVIEQVHLRRNVPPCPATSQV